MLLHTKHHTYYEKILDNGSTENHAQKNLETESGNMLTYYAGTFLALGNNQSERETLCIGKLLAVSWGTTNVEQIL